MASLYQPARRFAPARFKLRGAARAAETRLGELRDFGSNPGALRGFQYVPRKLQPGAPLVVVLHGCTQNASGYDRGSGWSRLADEFGFALLLPEQQRANNPNLCFNWFAPGDTARGSGEALSIRQMVAAMQAAHGTDPRRVFVTGLSAGGAMAAVMLATYPDVFAGGAVIAGLPFGAARSVPQALERMRGEGIPTPARLVDRVRAASGHSGPWPTVSVWHGSDDQTVSPANGQALVDQWRLLHELPAEPTATDTVDGHRRRSWLGSDGRPLVEDYRIGGMGHGTPLSTRVPGSGEVAQPHMLEAGISSTRRIASFWGIGDRVAPGAAPPQPAPAQPAPAQPAPTGVRKTIEDALRAAGLIR